MKTIPDELKSDIEDAATAGLLRNLPAVVAEKDQHITDALRSLAQIQVAERGRIYFPKRDGKIVRPFFKPASTHQKNLNRL